MFVHSLNEIFVVCFLLWLVTLKCIRMITFFCLVLTKASLMAGGEHGDMKKRIVVTCRLSHQKTTLSIPLSEATLKFTCSELEFSYREICNDDIICSTARQLLINERTKFFTVRFLKLVIVEPIGLPQLLKVLSNLEL